MRTGRKASVAVILLLLCAMQVPSTADDRIAGLVVGRTGEVLHVSMSQPVREGTTLIVKALESEPPIAQATVLSCTHERPYIALAKVVKADMDVPVPTGVRAYATVTTANEQMAPEPMDTGGTADGGRFSIQAGAFYPRTPSLRDTVADYWQAYRINYSLLKVSDLEAVLSAEYLKGSGEFSTPGGTVERAMEVIPVSVLGRVKPFRLGDARLFLGAGGGIYRIRNEERAGDTLTSSEEEEFGFELAAGLESSRGWVIELRYRDVQDTDIEGYSLAIGARF